MYEIINQIKDLLNKLLELQSNQIESNNCYSPFIFNDKTSEFGFNDKKVKLTHGELNVLKTFIENTNLFCTYDTLCRSIYDHPYDKTTESGMRAIIDRLRRKTKGILVIKNIRNLGYQVFTVDEL